jgi:uncharacterized protein (TIGR00725 family)
MKKKIGVIGSAAGIFKNDLIFKARDIGAEIAKYDCILVSGATTGLSYEATKGAKWGNGFTVGFSPAENQKEHVENYKLPIEGFDLIVYTGFGYKGRNVVSIRSCDAVIGISGRRGTLNEYTDALDENKTVGVLTGTGGISDMISEIEAKVSKQGGKIFYESNPKVLVKKVVESL